MIERNTLLWALIILLVTVMGFQLLIYMELRDLNERRTSHASVRRIHGAGKNT